MTPEPKVRQERLRELGLAAINPELPRIQRVAATTELLNEWPALLDRIEALEKGLRPFELVQRGFYEPGNCGPDMPRDWPDDVDVACLASDSQGNLTYPRFGWTVKVGDFRRLAKLLEEISHSGNSANDLGHISDPEEISAETIRAATIEECAAAIEERKHAYVSTRAGGWREVEHECDQCLAAIRTLLTQEKTT